MAGSAIAQDPFTQDVPLGKGTARVVVDFHDDHEAMVACSPEQIEWIGAHGIEKLTAILPVLNARLMSRRDPPGTTVEVLLDAACYDGGIMGMAGYGRGEEKIAMAYEESTLGGEWAPPARTPATPAQ